MRPRRLLAVVAGLAAVALAAGGCGIFAQPSAAIPEPVAQLKAPLAQTIYTAVDFSGRHGILTGYRQDLQDQPVPGGSLLWWTGDAGRSWHRTRLGNWQVQAVEMVGTRVGYLAAMNPNVGYAVLRTGDGGRSWHEVLPLQFPATFVQIWNRREVLVLSGGNLYSTRVGGSAWQAVHPDLSGIVAASFSSTLTGYAVAGTNVWTTKDGGVHWQVAYSLPAALVLQLGTATAESIDVPAHGGGWASFSLSACWPGGCPHVLLHQDPDGTWQIASGEDAGPIIGVAAAEDYFPGGAQTLWTTGPQSVVRNGPGGLWQTSDGGQTWQELGAPAAQQPSPAFVAVSGVLRHNIWAIGQDTWGGYLLHRTATGWRQVRPQPYPVSAVDFVTAKVGYGIGLSWSPGAVVGTRDGGRSWRVLTQVQGGLPVALDFTSPNHGYLATAGAGATVWQTTDGGRKWQRLQSLGAPPLSLAFGDPRHGAALLEVGPGWPLAFSLQETADGGRTWQAGSLPESLSDTLSQAQRSIVTSASAVVAPGGETYFLALVQRLPQLWRTSGRDWLPIDVPPGGQARGSGPEVYKGGAMSTPAPSGS